MLAEPGRDDRRESHDVRLLAGFAGPAGGDLSSSVVGFASCRPGGASSSGDRNRTFTTEGATPWLRSRLREAVDGPTRLRPPAEPSRADAWDVPGPERAPGHDVGLDASTPLGPRLGASASCRCLHGGVVRRGRIVCRSRQPSSGGAADVVRSAAGISVTVGPLDVDLLGLAVSVEKFTMELGTTPVVRDEPDRHVDHPISDGRLDGPPAPGPPTAVRAP